MRRILGGLAAMGMAAGTAAGAIVTWDGGAFTDNWHHANNWDTNTVPGSGDRVIIDGADVDIHSDVTIDSFHLKGSTALTVWGAKLTLENDEHLAHQCQVGVNCSDDSYFENDGIHSPSLIIQENATGNPGSVAIVNKEHEFWGFGVVLADADVSGTITIASGLTLTNGLRDDVGSSHTPAIRGAWTINGGSFLNDGRVEAVGHAGTGPDFSITSAIADTTRATWATGCNQELHLGNTSALDLNGDFEDVPDIHDKGGKFVFYGDVSTCGTLRLEGCGGIELPSSPEQKYFVYNGFFSDNGTCPNPGQTSRGCSFASRSMSTRRPESRRIPRAPAARADRSSAQPPPPAARHCKTGLLVLRGEVAVVHK